MSVSEKGGKCRRKRGARRAPDRGRRSESEPMPDEHGREDADRLRDGDCLRELREALRRFAGERDWERFHSPKNLANALIVEAAELLEPFQWLTDDESKRLSPVELEGVGEELADVLLYLVRLADVLGVDLRAAALRKLEINERKYPAGLARGNAHKRGLPPEGGSG